MKRLSSLSQFATAALLSILVLAGYSAKAQDDFQPSGLCNGADWTISSDAGTFVYNSTTQRWHICLPSCPTGTGCTSYTIRAQQANTGTTITNVSWENIGDIDRADVLPVTDNDDVSTVISAHGSAESWGKGLIRLKYTANGACECVIEFDTYQSFAPTDVILDPFCLQPGETKNFRIDGKVSRNAESGKIGIDGYTWDIDQDITTPVPFPYTIVGYPAGDHSSVDVHMDALGTPGTAGTLWVIQGNTCNSTHVEFPLAVDAEVTVEGCPDGVYANVLLLSCSLDPNAFTYTWFLNDVVQTTKSGPGQSSFSLDNSNLLSTLDEVYCVITPTPGLGCCVYATAEPWVYDDCLEFRKAAPNPKKLSVSPNPGHATIDVSVPFEGNEGEIRVRDISNKVVLKTKATAEKNTLNVGRLAKGVYTITYKSGKTVQTTKFIKE